VLERDFHREIQGGSDHGDPVSSLLTDKQFRLATRERFSRSVQLLNNSEGVQQLSQLDLAFDPKLETMCVHSIRIWRDGACLEKSDSEKFRLVQREQSLERQIYDGRLSALFLIEDVRPGDILDFSFTLKQDHGAFADHFFALCPMRWPIPIGSCHVSLLAPADDPPLRWKVQADPGGKVRPPEITEDGDERRYHWQQDNIAALAEIPIAPVWHPVIPILQVSDYEDWEQVGKWVVDLWNVDLVHQDLRDLTETFQSDCDDPVEHARRAVDFVQQDIRYLGLEDGIGGMRPSAPAEVLRRRFGDCKDKSLLLSTLLRMMKIPAAPVLVSFHLGKGVEDHLPMPSAFDHVIVRLQVGGRDIWIDATDAHQRGPLERRWPPNFGRGLQINSKSPRLVPIPDSIPDGTMLRVREDYELGAGERPARLEIQTLAKGLEASRTRAIYRTVGLARFSSGYEEEFQQVYPKAKHESELKLVDDEEANVIEIVETFTIPEFNRLTPDESARYAIFAPSPLRGRVSFLPDDIVPDTPWPIEFPCVVRNRIRVNVPWTTQVEPERETIDNDHFKFEFRSRQISEKKIEILYGYDSKSDHVSPEKVGRYRTDIDRLLKNTNYVIALDGVGQPSWDQRTSSSRRSRQRPPSHGAHRPQQGTGFDLRRGAPKWLIWAAVPFLLLLILSVVFTFASVIFSPDKPGHNPSSPHTKPSSKEKSDLEEVESIIENLAKYRETVSDPESIPLPPSLGIESLPESPQSATPSIDSEGEFKFDL